MASYYSTRSLLLHYFTSLLNFLWNEMLSLIEGDWESAEQYRYITLLEMYPTIFSPETLLDFHKTRLHEATLNLHTHTWIFCRL